MSTTYPTIKQEFTNPTTTSKLNSPSHTTLHANLADTLEAVEDKLGITGALISGCGGLYPGSDSATAMKLCKADGTTAVMVVDTTNGYVGINTGSNALAHLLTIQSTDGQGCAIERHSDNVNPPTVRFYKSRGSVASPSVLSDGDRPVQLEFWGYARNAGDTDNAYIRTGYIQSSVDGVDAQGRIGGKISFFTSAGISVVPSEHLSIDKDAITIHKIATATAVTQYDSWDLKFTCSVWDTTNEQAEDRTITMVMDAGSGADGSEPYKLQWKANDGSVIMDLDCTTSGQERINVANGIGHLDDVNTAILFSDDDMKVYTGSRLMVWAREAAQNYLYLGYDDDQDIDIYIGCSNCLFVSGETKRVSLNQTGTIQLYTYEGAVDDDTYFDLPDATSGQGMVNFDEGAEYAIFSFTDAGVVTLLANSANVANSQSDGNYCIYQNSTNVRIENKIGADSKNIKVFAWCN